MSKERNSQRRYPPRECKQTGKPFIPSDKRQIFTSKQERTDYHNDQRKIKEAAVKEWVAGALKNEALLEKIYLHLQTKNVQLVTSKGFLEYEGFDFYAPRKNYYNEATKKLTDWYFSFGIEIASDEPGKTTYTIIKKD